MSGGGYLVMEEGLSIGFSVSLGAEAPGREAKNECPSRSDAREGSGRVKPMLASVRVMRRWLLIQNFPKLSGRQ